MPVKQSLFAQKLKAWRASHGDHGRVTQDGLADLLGVSVDAIGKYERSVSFIRGDLEHRLSDRLGWSRNEIIACREDWELRHHAPDQSSYRIVDQQAVDDLFDGSWDNLVDAMNTMASAQFDSLQIDCGINRSVFDPIYAHYRNQWRAVERDGKIVAKWVMLTLFDQDEELLKARKLDENNLTLDRVCQPILPGTYYGYCPAVVVCPGHESASTLLISSFVDYLEELATSGVLFHGLGTVAVSRGGERICKGIGMDYLGQYEDTGGFSVWNLTGAGIARSIFVSFPLKTGPLNWPRERDWTWRGSDTQTKTC
jgi:hypothetical protein